MRGTVLVTGGAGFIGSHLADELIGAGWTVRALDDLAPQVHGPGRTRPPYLAEEVDLRVGDVRDPAVVREALLGVDAVVHLAAAVGVGQSMYRIAEYTSVNNLGTAVLLEALTDRPVSRLVVASSMSLYGEGRYVDDSGRIRDDVRRSLQDLEAGVWEPVSDGEALRPVPTPEDKAPDLASIYALSKFDQERMCRIWGRAYRHPTVALRFFNTYGPRQALSNPYTGVLAIFASRLLNGRPPLVFEDGLQQRDFVSVHDVARACRLALERDAAVDGVFNIGSGVATTVRDVARRVAAAIGRDDLVPEITGRHRVGDIRHCVADIDRARRVLGYAPRVSLEEGLRELAYWLVEQQADDGVEHARRELETRGLTL